jgi:CheY-like chemotaxis protein
MATGENAKVGGAGGQPPGRLLVTDDDVDDVRLTLSALRASGIEEDVMVLADGKDLLDYLYRRGPFVARPLLHPALVLLDLKMPRVDGFEVLESAKGDPALRVIPIVVLTSSRQERDLAQAYALGANGYMVKPMNFEEYVAALGALWRYWLEVNEASPACMGRTPR